LWSHQPAISTPQMSSLSLHAALPIFSLLPSHDHDAFTRLRRNQHASKRSDKGNSRVINPESLWRESRNKDPGQCGSDKDDEYCADRKSTRLNSSHVSISYADFCLKKK